MTFAPIARRVYAALLKALEWMLIGLFVVLTLNVLWGVFSRYVLGAQSRWTEELAIYLLIWVSLLGSSVAYAEGGHLGIDYLIGKLEPSAQRVGAISVELLVGTFSAAALVYGGWVLVTRTLESGQLSPSLGIPTGYLYLAVPISGVFFVLFCIRRLLALFGPAAPSPPADTLLEG